MLHKYLSECKGCVRESSILGARAQPAPRLMDGWWLAYDPHNDIPALNEPWITQHKDILLIFCRIFAKADSGLAVQWNNLRTSIFKQNEFVNQEWYCHDNVFSSWLHIFQNWWSIAMYCWGFMSIILMESLWEGDGLCLTRLRMMAAICIMLYQWVSPNHPL